MPVNNASGSSERITSAATRFAEAAKKSGIFKRSTDAIKSASRQSLPSGSDNVKAASRQSTESEREAKRARKAERNRRKANAAKRRK